MGVRAIGYKSFNRLKPHLGFFGSKFCLLMEVILLLLSLATAVWGAPLTKTYDCPSGWVNAHEDGCFKFLGDKLNLTWFEAMVACEKEGGYLAEPKTKRQMEFLKGLVELEDEFYGGREWWLGLSDTGHEGTWVWTHSYEEVSETSWAPGQPSHFEGNDFDCAIAVLADSYGRELVWDDVSCEETIPNDVKAPLCQRDMENPHTTTHYPTGTTPWTTTTTAWWDTTTRRTSPGTTTTTTWWETTTRRTTPWPQPTTAR